MPFIGVQKTNHQLHWWRKAAKRPEEGIQLSLHLNNYSNVESFLLWVIIIIWLINVCFHLTRKKTFIQLHTWSCRIQRDLYVLWMNNSNKTYLSCPFISWQFSILFSKNVSITCLLPITLIFSQEQFICCCLAERQVLIRCLLQHTGGILY